MRNLLSALILSAAVSWTHADPIPSAELELSRTINLAADLSIGGSSTFNPRYFGDETYANQINIPGFAVYPANSIVPSVLGYALGEHRMVAPFPGANRGVYILGASGATTTTLTRYDANGENAIEANVPGDAQTTEGFDWVDDNTIIYTTYNPSANRKRLSLAHVEAEPFEVTPDTRWNANGFITTSVSSRIRNVRVGDVYNGYAYYGDAGQNTNPNFYAINLATGAETPLGNAGELTGTGSFGVWTVLEKDGNLYVQTTDNGIQVYAMSNATTLGPLIATYTKERLDELTGYTAQYYGLDVSDQGKLLLGAAGGMVFELGATPALRLTTTFNLAADSGVAGNGIFNPRLFDGDVYVNQINTPAFGRYTLGSPTPSIAIPSVTEHRMIAPFRGANSSNYLLGSSGATTTTFSRYDFTGENQVEAPVPGDNQTAEGFDWVDENTIIYTTYNPSGNRKRISLAHVMAEPFSVAADTRWNANGFITTSVSTRIRNVRVGDVYSGYAYYGDAGQNANPNFYAINLATGEETLLGNAGTLTGTGSFGLWTVVERGGKLFVQTTDNGVQVYNMTSATALGSLATTYSKADLDEATGYTGQYWGFDASSDGRTLILGGSPGLAWELEATLKEPLVAEISRAGSDVVISWPEAATGVAVEFTTDLTVPFAPLDPQPAVVTVNGKNTVTIPASAPHAFYRLRQ